MFGFVSKFKQEVQAYLQAHTQEVSDGFDSIKQRLVTLEAQVAALFSHTQTVEAAKEADVVGPVTEEVKAEDTDHAA